MTAAALVFRLVNEGKSRKKETTGQQIPNLPCVVETASSCILTTNRIAETLQKTEHLNISRGRSLMKDGSVFILSEQFQNRPDETATSGSDSFSQTLMFPLGLAVGRSAAPPPPFENTLLHFNQCEVLSICLFSGLLGSY